MLSRFDTILLIVFVLILALALRGHAALLCPPDSYACITGAACLEEAAVKMAYGCQVHIDGVIVGGGDSFYDLKALDSTPVRVSWTFDAKLTQGQRVMIRGWLDRAGHISAAGLVL